MGALESPNTTGPRRFPRRAHVVWAAVLVPPLLLLSTLRTSLSLEELRPTYGAPPSTFVEVLGMQVHCRVEGHGPALVLLHGTFSSLHTWDGWTAQLANDFTIIRFDLPGHGLTGPDPTRGYGIERSVAFVDELTHRLGFERFHLAGNSLGGHVAWRFAAAHPERVDRLILIDSAGLPRSRTPPIIAAARLPVVNQLFRVASPRFLFWRLLRGVYGDPSKITQATVDRYQALVRREGNREALLDRLSAPDLLRPELLRRLQMPTLVMWGLRDSWIPPSESEGFVVALPHAQPALFPTLGHVPMEEEPVATAREARRFLLK